jgi:hypothetical protein
MSSHTVTSQDEQDLVRVLAERVLEVTAPEELAVFDETAQEYFADPQGVLEAGGRDELVGSGVELALLTPYVLAVVTPVIQLLASMVGEAVKKERQSSVTAFVRRLIGPQGSAPPGAAAEKSPTPSPLTQEQVVRVHDVALNRAALLGLPQDTATLLADAIVGGISVSPAT